MQGLLLPQFQSASGRFEVTFFKNLYTVDKSRSAGLNERQAKTLQWVLEHGRISSVEYQSLFQVSQRTASRELADLVKRGVLEKIGRAGRNVHYQIKTSSAKDAVNAP